MNVLANPHEANTEFNVGNPVGGEVKHEVPIGNLEPMTRSGSCHLREEGVVDILNFPFEGNV